jgi:hypothetical protein
MTSISDNVYHEVGMFDQEGQVWICSRKYLSNLEVHILIYLLYVYNAVK